MHRHQSLLDLGDLSDYLARSAPRPSYVSCRPGWRTPTASGRVFGKQVLGTSGIGTGG